MNTAGRAEQQRLLPVAEDQQRQHQRRRAGQEHRLYTQRLTVGAPLAVGPRRVQQGLGEQPGKPLVIETRWFAGIVQQRQQIIRQVAPTRHLHRQRLTPPGLQALCIRPQQPRAAAIEQRLQLAEGRATDHKHFPHALHHDVIVRHQQQGLAAGQALQHPLGQRPVGQRVVVIGRGGDVNQANLPFSSAQMLVQISLDTVVRDCEQARRLAEQGLDLLNGGLARRA